MTYRMVRFLNISLIVNVLILYYDICCYIFNKQFNKSLAILSFRLRTKVAQYPLICGWIALYFRGYLRFVYEPNLLVYKSHIFPNKIHKNIICIEMFLHGLT